MEIIESNSMRKTQLPQKLEVEQFPNFYTKKQLENFFDCLETHIKTSGRTSTKLLVFFRLLAFTGMRKSETLALQWQNINLLNQTLTIGKTLALDKDGKIIIQEPKTKSSQRINMLDKKTIKILQEWRINQKQWYFKLGYNTSK